LSPKLRLIKVCLKIIIRRKLAAAFSALSAQTKRNKKLGIKDVKVNCVFSTLGAWLNLNKEFRHCIAHKPGRAPGLRPSDAESY
jgi:hypothetical protein